MKDNKLKKLKPRSPGLYDPDEALWLHRQFPALSHAAIITAIKKAGPARKNIVEWLKRKGQVQQIRHSS
jgi:hypothetical protein